MPNTLPPPQEWDICLPEASSLLEIAKGERDLSGLISALSSPERDFNFPAAWRASCPPSLYGEEPTWREALEFVIVAWFKFFSGLEGQYDFPIPPSTRSLLCLIRNDYRALYHGIRHHPHLRILLIEASINSTSQFNTFILKGCQAWNDVTNEAVAALGPVGNVTKQAPPLFAADLVRMGKAMAWSVGGHRDYAACVLFAKVGARAAVLLSAESWDVENSPLGSNSWKIVLSDTKVYGRSAPASKFVVWYHGYDGYRFGLFFKNRNRVVWNSPAGAATLFKFGTTADFVQGMQRHLVTAGYPASYGTGHSWRVGLYNSALAHALSSGAPFSQALARMDACLVMKWSNSSRASTAQTYERIAEVDFAVSNLQPGQTINDLTPMQLHPDLNKHHGGDESLMPLFRNSRRGARAKFTRSLLAELLVVYDRCQPRK